MPVPTAPAVPLDAPVCPLCGGPNGCAPVACGRFDTACWCTAVQIDPAVLARIPEPLRGQACLCRRCATGTPPQAQDAGTGSGSGS